MATLMWLGLLYTHTNRWAVVVLAVYPRICTKWVYCAQSTRKVLTVSQWCHSVRPEWGASLWGPCEVNVMFQFEVTVVINEEAWTPWVLVGYWFIPLTSYPTSPLWRHGLSHGHVPCTHTHIYIHINIYIHIHIYVQYKYYANIIRMKRSRPLCILDSNPQPSPFHWHAGGGGGSMGSCSGLVWNRPAARCKEAQCSSLQRSAPPVCGFELYSKLKIWINGGYFLASQSLCSSIYTLLSCCVISNNIYTLQVWAHTVSSPWGLCEITVMLWWHIYKQTNKINSAWLEPTTFG